MRAATTHGALALALLMGLAGCAAGPLRIEGGDAALPDESGSAEYLGRMADQRSVSENDGMRAMLLLLEGKDDAKTFDQRVRKLLDRGVVCPRWSFSAARPLTKGKLAYMVYQACKIPGGVTLRLTGPSQRYCLRELQYRGMIAPGIMNTEVTGMEFVAVVTRADAHLETGRVPDAMLIPAGGS